MAGGKAEAGPEKALGSLKRTCFISKESECHLRQWEVSRCSEERSYSVRCESLREK